MNKPLKNLLLSINNGYTFFVASMHMGLMTSLVLFWYASWEGLKIDTIQNNFGIPATLATKLFVILIPIMMITTTVMIISEWKTALKWPSIVVLIGIMGSTITAKYFIFPVNDIIYAGVKTNEELEVLLLRWMALNNWRVFFSVLTWLGMFAFYTMKSNRKTS